MQPVIVYRRETSIYGKSIDNYLTIYFPQDIEVKNVVSNVLNTTQGVKSWFSFKDNNFDCFLMCYVKGANPEEVDVVVKLAIEDTFKE